MTLQRGRPSVYGLFKSALAGLVVLDCLVYAWRGTPAEAADALAWLALLVLFFWEAAGRARVSRPAVRAGVRLARGMAAIAVAGSALAYVEGRAWLDAVNSGLWIAVVILLEIQVRNPRLVARARAAFTAVAATLYGGLVVLPGVWLAQGEWFAAYDAVLWLAAFAVIEVDVLAAHRAAGNPWRSRGAAEGGAGQG